MKITAAVTESAHAPFALQELELGDLRPDEVLVHVAAAGICHTDLIMRDQWAPVPLPAVLGHEGAGVVEAVGSAVTLVAPGARVGMSFDSCGHCPTCRTGRPAYCHAFWDYNLAATRADGTSALSRDGGLDIHGHFFGQSCFATYAVASERNVIILPDSIPLEVAAPVRLRRPDRRRRSARLAARSGRQHPGRASGPAQSASRPSWRESSRAARRSLASIATPHASSWRASSGRRTSSMPACRDAAEEIVRITRLRRRLQRGNDGGVAAVLRQAVDCLAPRGTCGVIGAAAVGTEVSLDLSTILNRAVRGIIEGDSVPHSLLPRLIELWAQGKFPVERMMTFYDFDQIEEAARDAEDGRVVKPVLRMGA